MDEIDPIFYKPDFDSFTYFLRYFVTSHEAIQYELKEKMLRYHKIATEEIQMTVQSYYSLFNGSVRKYSEIYRKFTLTENHLLQIKERMERNRILLKGKRTNISELLSKRNEAKKVLELIIDVQSIFTSPALAVKQISNKEYTAGVETIDSALRKMFSEPIVRLEAVEETRDTLMEMKLSLVNDTIDELRAYTRLQDVFMILRNGPLSFEECFVILKDAKFTLGNERIRNTLKGLRMLRKNTEALVTLKSCLEEDLAQVLSATASLSYFMINRSYRQSRRRSSLLREDRIPLFGTFSIEEKENLKSHTLLLIGLWKIVLQRHQTVLDLQYDNEEKNDASEGNEAEAESIKSQYITNDVRRKIKELTEIHICLFLDDQKQTDGNQERKPSTNDTYRNTIEKSRRKKQKSNLDTISFRLCDNGNGGIEKSSWIVTKETTTAQEKKKEILFTPNAYRLPIIYKHLHDFWEYCSEDDNEEDVMPFLDTYITETWLPRMQNDVDEYNFQVCESTKMDGSSPFVFSRKSHEDLLVIVKKLSEIVFNMAEYRQNIFSVIQSAMKKWETHASSIYSELTRGLLSSTEWDRTKETMREHFHNLFIYKLSVAEMKEIEKKKGNEINFSDDEKDCMKSLIETEIDLEVELRNRENWENVVLASDINSISNLASLCMTYDNISQGLSEIAANSREEEKPFMERIQEGAEWYKTASDDCLFTLRKELHLQCFYHLHELGSLEVLEPSAFSISSFDTDTTSSSGNATTMIAAHECILNLNKQLATVKDVLCKFLDGRKCCLLFFGLDTILAYQLIENLSTLAGRLLTKLAVRQMQANLWSLEENMTVIFYNERILQTYLSAMFRDCSFIFGNARRFYDILLLSDEELEKMIHKIKKDYRSANLRSLWRVVTPQRIPTDECIRRFDQILEENEDEEN